MAQDSTRVTRQAWSPQEAFLIAIGATLVKRVETSDVEARLNAPDGGHPGAASTLELSTAHDRARAETRTRRA
jgi:hypothetical protein